MQRFSGFVLLLMLLFAGCARQELLPVPDPEAAPADNTLPGQALLLLSDEAADAFGQQAPPASLDGLGVRCLERVFPDAGEFEAKHRAAGLHRWYRVSYDPAASRTKAGEALGALPGVEAVQFPPRRVRTALPFNDPHLSLQWNYFNDGSMRGFKAGADIHVVPVWEQYTAGSSDVIVAVVDGGVDRSHEDLAGVVLSAAEGSRNFVPGYAPERITADDHGTHVAGTIAAVNDNGKGVAGIAGGRNGRGGVRIMSCVIFGDDDTAYYGDEDARALVWAADHGAVIANNSWAFDFDSEKDAADYARYFISTRDDPTKSAIDYFIANAGTDAQGRQTGPMKGGVVFFASGNEGWQYAAPSCYDPVIAVGAFGPDGKMPEFANYGPWVDILAPGGSDSDSAYEEWILSTVAGGEYAYFPGTSMAAPHAAGVAALLVSYFGGPGFTPDQLKEALLNGAVDDIDLQGRTVGGGRLDALGAFSAMQGQGDPDDATISFSTDYSGSWQIPSHETLTLTVSVNGNGSARLPVTFSSDCPGATASCTYSRVSVSIDALRAEPGDYSFTVRAGSGTARTFPFTILPNHAPRPVLAPEDRILNAASAAVSTVDLSGCFEDPDGETPVLKILLSGDDILSATLSGTTLTLTPKGYGLATVTLEASDARGASCTASFRVLARNDYRDLDIYPNPVTDWLHVRPGRDRTLSVQLYNRLGACVYEREGAAAGPFAPLDIDMRALPGGSYTLSVNGQAFTIARP